MKKFKFSQNPNERKKERKKERKMSATTSALQELLKYDKDAFISDELDGTFYDDNTYNWEVLFETVKFFVMKEGR